MKKDIFFKRELTWIKNKDIEELFIACRDSAPDYFYCIPASTSGKYHAEYELNLGGLYRHSLGVARFMHHFLSIEQYAKEFTEREQDLLILGCCYHDVLKCGTNGSLYTVQDHPLQGAAYVREQNAKLKCPLQSEEIDFVCAAMSSHMGQWCTNKKGEQILPTPSTEAEKLLHLADFLASRKDLEVHFGFDEELEDEITEPELTEEDVIVSFGKYKGYSFKEVKRDADYVRWLWSAHCDTDNKKLVLTEPLLSFVHAFVDSPTEEDEDNIDDWEI